MLYGIPRTVCVEYCSKHSDSADYDYYEKHASARSSCPEEAMTDVFLEGQPFESEQSQAVAFKV